MLSNFLLNAQVVPFGIFGNLVQIVVIVVILAGVWKTFEKMGRQGWEGIIPFYNIYVLLTIIGKPAWWLLLFFIPIVNLIVAFIVYKEIAERFNQSVVIAILMFFGVGWLILGFGDAKYSGSSEGMDDVLDS